VLVVVAVKLRLRVMKVRHHLVRMRRAVLQGVLVHTVLTRRRRVRSGCEKFYQVLMVSMMTLVLGRVEAMMASGRIRHQGSAQVLRVLLQRLWF
jgi:hypothetical protein